MKERGLVRKGNRQFKREQFEKSVDSYQRALQHDSTSFEAKYDLASALYRTERYEKAEKTLQSIVNDTTRTELERGEVAYNLGNTQFAQQKYKEALSSYRHAMRCNPNDEDAKFNYAFTKRLIQQQEQQQQQQQNQDQNQDQQNQDKNQQEQNQNQDKNQDQNKEQQNQQEQQQQPQDQNGKEEQQGQGQQPEGAMSPEQAEAMLQAIQAEEDKTQDKLKEKAGVLIRGGKNW
ncbi:MAG: tetratricopeptide repeat protein [Rikenellaceae bacterium]|nr:tetratricopeptide repeat protein [Rikenellaceae bacterium]